MAITATHLTTAGNEDDQTSYQTASITPSANKLILLAVYSRLASSAVSTPTISGNGLTWVKIAERAESGAAAQKISLFRAMGLNPSSGVVTIDFGSETQQRCLWTISEFGEVDRSGTSGSGAIVQNVTNIIEGTNTGLTVTLSAFEHANNATYGTVRSGNAITPGSGFTELGEVNVSSFLQAQWRDSNDTSVDWSWASTVSFGVGIAVEIRHKPDPISITKSAQYTVITESAITKSAQYTVIAPKTITKSLQYIVDSNAVLMEKELSYTVITEQAVTKQIVYMVAILKSITKSAQYTVVAPKQLSKSAQYTVITSVAVTKDLTYRIIPLTVVIPKGLEYAVKGSVILRKNIAYLLRVDRYNEMYFPQNTTYDEMYPPHET